MHLRVLAEHAKRYPGFHLHMQAEADGLVMDGDTVTVDGVAVRLTVAAPGAFGTALIRATGTAAYVQALGPLPDGPDEAAVYAARLAER